MSFTRLAFLKSWLSNTDFPTLEESESKVREDFQYHPDAIKEYLNNVFLREMENSGADSIGTSDGRSVGKFLEDLQTYSRELNDAIQELASGGAPDAFKASKVPFAENEWANGKLIIAQGDHKRKNDAFVYSIRALDNGKYVSDSWHGACTNVVYDAATGDITLEAEEPYSGEIVFYGL